MEKIVECVPNFSEGGDAGLIRQITDTISGVDGIDLRDVDPGADTNRVVVTFFGSPEAVSEAAFRAIAKAAELIDMRSHRGAHPRMGATDVCPFVPVNDVSMEDCAELARKLGRRVGDELGIPVYLYEAAASRPERRNLANVRRGEYEGLGARFADPDWRPDFGPVEGNERAGATAIGAREFLIAYNISLNSRNKDHATDIAFELREKGRSARRGNTQPFYNGGKLLKHGAESFHCGSCEFVAKQPEDLSAHTSSAHDYDYAELLALHDLDPSALVGKSVKRPGLFSHCKAIGWAVPEYDRVQISINLTDYKVTSPQLVLEKARELAAERSLVVTGSEIVGLVPLKVMLDAGRFYLERQGRPTSVPERDILSTAVQSMGLNDVSAFDIEEKVIGYRPPPDDALISMRTSELVHEVSRDSPAPGGGSVAALAGALGAALGSMVANLTLGKRGFESAASELQTAASEAQQVKDGLLAAVDADTEAFNAYLEALRLPRGNEAERETRKLAMQAGLKVAVAVPMETARLSLRALDVAQTVARLGSPASVTDAGVGAELASAGLRGGVLNARVNLGDIEDAAFATETRQACDELIKEARRLLDETMTIVEQKLP